MILIHKGVRPTYDIQMLDFKRKIYLEELPCGGYRLWNRRQLFSGCDNETDSPMEMRGCYYCKTCDEWFNKEQWREYQSDRRD